MSNLEPNVKLNELDKQEWWDVYRQFRPDATEAEFDTAWNDFQKEKAKRSMQ